MGRLGPVDANTLFPKEGTSTGEDIASFGETVGEPEASVA